MEPAFPSKQRQHWLLQNAPAIGGLLVTVAVFSVPAPLTHQECEANASWLTYFSCRILERWKKSHKKTSKFVERKKIRLVARYSEQYFTCTAEKYLRGKP